MSTPLYNRDILTIIIQHLTYENIQQLKITNKYFNTYIHSLPIWKQLAQRDFLNSNLITYSLYRNHYQTLSDPKKYKFCVQFVRKFDEPEYCLSVSSRFLCHQVDDYHVIQVLRDADFNTTITEPEIAEDIDENKPVCFNIIFITFFNNQIHYMKFDKKVKVLIDLKIGEEKTYETKLSDNISLKFHIYKTINSAGNVYQILFPCLMIKTATLRQLIVDTFGKGGIQEID